MSLQRVIDNARFEREAQQLVRLLAVLPTLSKDNYEFDGELLLLNKVEKQDPDTVAVVQYKGEMIIIPEICDGSTYTIAAKDDDSFRVGLSGVLMNSINFYGNELNRGGVIGRPYVGIPLNDIFCEARFYARE